MDLLILAGLVCVVPGIIYQLSPETVDAEQTRYIIRGLMLAFMAVGLYVSGGMLIHLISIDIPDATNAVWSGIALLSLAVVTRT